MPLYSFALQPGLGTASTIGEFADDAGASNEADRLAGDLVRHFRPMSRGERVSVRNSSGNLIYEAYLSIADKAVQARHREEKLGGPALDLNQG